MISILFAAILSLALASYYEFSMHRLLAKSVHLYHINDIEVRLLDRGLENAMYVSTLLFRKKIVVFQKDVKEDIIKHELGHVGQPNVFYIALIIAPFIAAFNILLLIPLALLTKALAVYEEYEADKVVGRPLKFEDSKPRPKSRLRRLYAWILENHPPDWVREREDYLQKNIVALFIEDVLR